MRHKCPCADQLVTAHHALILRVRADMVLAAEALPQLLALLQPNSGSTKSMVRNATWTLSNFCRGKPPPPFERTRVALPTLKHLIMQNDNDLDEEILTDACWALSYLSDGPNERIQAVIHANICRRLVELLGYQKDTVLVPALRTVGNIVTGTDEQTQTVINCNALQVRAGRHLLSSSLAPSKLLPGFVWRTWRSSATVFKFLQCTGNRLCSE
jgi:Armadillo/beta-catenin-like repeat